LPMARRVKRWTNRAFASERRIALVVVSAIVLSLTAFCAVAATDEEICRWAVSWFDYDGVRYWTPDKNERLIRIVRDLGARELPADGILICSGEGWHGRALYLLRYFGAETLVEERRGLAVHLEFLREAPDDIVTLAVQHEIGHLVHQQGRQACSDPYDNEIAKRCEREADDAAAEIVGPCAVARLLSWVVDYYERHNVSIYTRDLAPRIERQKRAGNCPAPTVSNPLRR